MAARLKVFLTTNGLTDYVVAASSRPKALEAWGVRQDLFKEGAAREIDDPDLVKAALAQPGEVLERAGGSRDALKAQAARIKTPTKPKGPSAADLKRRKALTDKLATLEARHAEALAELARERQALEARERKISAAFEDQRDKVRRALDSSA